MQRTIGAIDAGEGRRVPWIRVRAEQPGPTAIVTANIHGDEVTGVAAAHSLDRWLRDNLESGQVILYPTLNPAGLEAGTRNLPKTRTDLNRNFPGAGRRSEERLAVDIWRHLERNSPDLVIDLHADSADAVPYAIVDRPVRLPSNERARMGDRLDTLAAASGLLVLREYPDDQYIRYGLDRSLAGAVVNRLRVPAVTLEVGPRRYAHPDAVRTTVHAAIRVLGAAGLVDTPAAEPTNHGGPWRRAAAPRVRNPGLFTPALRPGDRFDKGSCLGTMHDAAGSELESLQAPAAGVVVSWQERSWIGAGGVVGTLGVLDS